MPHWSRAYLGLPYEARGRSPASVDCWGLPCLVYAERLGIELPSYAGAYVNAAEREQAEALFRGEFKTDAWRDPVTPREYDLAWFRSPTHGGATHVGIVLGPELMLHADEGRTGVSCIDPYATGPWSRLLIGFRRHAAMWEPADAV